MNAEVRGFEGLKREEESKLRSFVRNGKRVHPSLLRARESPNGGGGGGASEELQSPRRHRRHRHAFFY